MRGCAPQNVNLGATPIADDASEVGATITVTLSVPFGSGTLAVDGTIVNGLMPAQISGNGTNFVTLVGTVAQIDTTLAATGGLKYTAPTPTFNGTVVMTIFANDGGANGSGGVMTSSISFNLSVGALNDAPVITVPATTVGSPLAINQGTLNSIGGVSVADPDINQGAGNHLFNVELTASGTGTITLGTIAGLDFVSLGTLGVGAGDGSADTFMRFQGSSTDVNNALASLKYQNAFNGAATITVTVSDQGNSGTDPGVSGGPNDERDSETIFLNVTQVNTPPVNFVPGCRASMKTIRSRSAHRRTRSVSPTPRTRARTTTR